MRAWRRLTGGRGVPPAQRRTLVACSGGADSSFLVLVLASVGADAVVAHVVHDLRPRAEALADRDAAAALAAALGLPFADAEVRVRRASGTARRGRALGTTNPEGAARRKRYAALTRLAARTGCRYVATAHHADDALEGLLMGLMRGVGPAGLAGVAERRPLARDIVLIRPMLEIRRADCERVCRGSGWAWREDATNRDQSRLRAAVRHRVMPELERLRPGAAVRAVRTARLQRGAAALVRERAAALWACGEPREGRVEWGRGLLRGQPEVVLGGLLRLTVRELRRGRGMDRAGWARVGPIVGAIRDGKTDPRRYRIAGVDVEVRAKHVAANVP